MRKAFLVKCAVLVVAAFGFGVTVSVIKGNGSGIRDAIGNTSAPWLMLPFVAVLYWRTQSAIRGALVGLAASLTALSGFYIANSFVLDLGPHTWLQDLSLTVHAGEMFFALAVVSGPFFGALGALWHRTRSTAMAVLVAALFVFEPLASWLYGFIGPNGRVGVPVVWFGELAVGLCACAALAALLPRLLRGAGAGLGPDGRHGLRRRP
jgi:hypothetical protein